MNKVIITSDSGIDPTDNTYMIPVQINDTTNQIGYRDDGLSINVDKILDDAKKGIYYKTSAPLTTDYYDMWDKIIKQGDDIVHLCLSDKISSTSYLLSNNIAEEFNDRYGKHIYVVNSLTGGTGGTALYKKAMELNDDNPVKLYNEMSTLAGNIKTAYFVPNPMGFIRSGRNSKALDLAEAAIKRMNLKFRVDFSPDGTLSKKEIYRGSNEKNFYKMLDKVLNNDIDKDIVIGTVKEQDINMDRLQTYLESKDYNVTRQDINGCVAAYGSPDLVGISYMLKK